MPAIKTPKKLIEVALPLDAINAAAAREKSIRHGHPSTLHLWWARRPLAAARAVIFAQMVNDPGYERQYQRGMNKEAAARERERLFKIIEDLVQWENTTNEDVLERAREEIRKSWRETCRLNKDHPQAAELFNPDKLPAFHDPFAGGGALPLEAQRLGLESWASDLNPVAVTINKAMIQKQSSMLDLQNQQTALYSTIENYWLQANTSQSQFKAARQSTESAKASYELLSEQFQLGLKNIVELMTGKDNLIQAQQNELQAKYLTILNIDMLNFYQTGKLK